MTKPLAPNRLSSSGPALLTVAEACASLRISRWTFYRLVQRGELKTVKIGSARRVPIAAINELVAHLCRQEDAQP
jgi:excisionase family DNA binding protein